MVLRIPPAGLFSIFSMVINESKIKGQQKNLWSNRFPPCNKSLSQKTFMITGSSSWTYDVTGSCEPPDKGAGNPTWQDHCALLTTKPRNCLIFFEYTKLRNFHTTYSLYLSYSPVWFSHFHKPVWTISALKLEGDTLNVRGCGNIRHRAIDNSGVDPPDPARANPVHQGLQDHCISNFSHVPLDFFPKNSFGYFPTASVVISWKYSIY